MLSQYRLCISGSAPVHSVGRAMAVMRGNPGAHTMPNESGEFFKGPLVQVFKACTNGFVSLSQTEEALMARPRQNPSLNNLYADFSLGFILGFSWTGGQHRCRVMTHKVLCGTPQRGFVAIWLCNERRIVWSNEGGHTSDKFHRIDSRA